MCCISWVTIWIGEKPIIDCFVWPTMRIEKTWLWRKTVKTCFFSFMHLHTGMPGCPMQPHGKQQELLLSIRCFNRKAIEHRSVIHKSGQRHGPTYASILYTNDSTCCNVNLILCYDPITKSEGISIRSPVYLRLTATSRVTKFDGLTFFFYYTGQTFKYCSKQATHHWYVLVISIQTTSTSLQWLCDGDDAIILKRLAGRSRRSSTELSPVRRRAPKNTVNARKHTNDGIRTHNRFLPVQDAKSNRIPNSCTGLVN